MRESTPFALRHHLGSFDALIPITVSRERGRAFLSVFFQHITYGYQCAGQEDNFANSVPIKLEHHTIR